MERQKRYYWAKVGLQVRNGFRMHRVSGQLERGISLLQGAGFSERVIRLANSTGGHTTQLVETRRILDQEELSEEIGKELEGHPLFDGMNNHDAISIVSHGIERRLAQRIAERTGETIDPILIPELVDQKIKQLIENRP